MSDPQRSTTHDVLPPLYARWMDEALPGPIAPETNATCSDCAMCRKGDDDASQAGFWEPDVKCCSYLPRLSNYLVGGALLDTPTDDVAREGRRQLEARIDAGVAVYPLGLLQNPAYMLLYKGSQNAFGRSRAMRCPHWVDANGGMCGVWRHRESTCATFFCKHVRGAVGKQMWTAVQALLGLVENNLALWCVLELDVGVEALRRLVGPGSGGDRDRVGHEQLDGRASPESGRAVWGSWHGREREFYMECARRVQSLSWAEVERICGPAATAGALVARKAFADASRTDVPPYLALVPLQIARAKSPTGERVARIASYSGSDPLILPERLADSLGRFDGTRATNEVIFDIVAEARTGLNRALVRRLVDFGVLAEVPAPAAAVPAAPAAPGLAVPPSGVAAGA